MIFDLCIVDTFRFQDVVCPRTTLLAQQLSPSRSQLIRNVIVSNQVTASRSFKNKAIQAVLSRDGNTDSEGAGLRGKLKKVVLAYSGNKVQEAQCSKSSDVTKEVTEKHSVSLEVGLL